MAKKLKRSIATWQQYHDLKDKVDEAVEELAKFAMSFGWDRRSIGSTIDEAMWPAYDELEEFLEKKFGHDPLDDEEDIGEDGLRPDFDEDNYGADY